jgi:hypothetical protein
MADPGLPKVVAAAIKDEHGEVWHLPPPARHHDVLTHMVRSGAKDPVPDAQGFLMSDGTFADRRRAKVCAEFNRQIEWVPNGPRLMQLFSEDLW